MSRMHRFRKFRPTTQSMLTGYSSEGNYWTKIIRILQYNIILYTVNPKITLQIWFDLLFGKEVNRHRVFMSGREVNLNKRHSQGNFDRWFSLKLHHEPTSSSQPADDSPALSWLLISWVCVPSPQSKSQHSPSVRSTRAEAPR